MAAPGARALPVFPGAEGFGTETVAGRGSAGAPAIIYTVTSLADSDPTVEGEFRYGVETLSGPRVIVFAVSGVIELKKSNSRPQHPTVSHYCRANRALSGNHHKKLRA